MRSKNISINKHTIVIFGSKGMLGKNILFYFKKKNKILKFEKKFNASSFVAELKKLNSKKPHIIFNCIGKIPQKTKNSGKMMFSNYQIPKLLEKNLDTKHLLIHPSTDCVFNGKLKKGKYSKNKQPDAKDIYGKSKHLGEKALLNRPNTLIIRVSIIGKNLYSKKNLLTWFLSSKKEIYGYNNHFWNGVTTLEWCKKVKYIIQQNNFKKKAKLYQLGTKKTYSKYEMLKIFKNIFKRKIKIISIKKNFTNRCLKPDFFSSDLEKQLREFKLQKYYKKL